MFRASDEIPAKESRADKGKTAARQSRYKTGGKYREKYREQSAEKYLSRKFIAWDGEGITRADGSHDYVMLANSEGGRIGSALGLGTVALFDFLLEESERIGDGIHVIYGGGYDFNMMFRDMTEAELSHVYHDKTASIRGYHLEWRPGKTLYIRRGKRHIRIQDVVSFFQTSFVNACDSYLGDDWYERERVVREKQRRGSFTAHELDEMATYNDAELVNLVRLCEELRARLYRAGIRIGRWDGPGAVAASLLKTYGVKENMSRTIPEPVAEAARYAYMGGRFECFQFGYREAPVYQYDIKSAYPSAMRFLPCLAHGNWVHYDREPERITAFGIYHVAWTRNSGRPTYPALPAPFGVRYHDGSVGYPEFGETWVWGPEIETAKFTGESFEILEAWVWEPECSHEPFAFVEGLYRKRQILQRQNDGAHVGLKLGLNSLYGKLAQQLGAEEISPGEWKLPPFHQLEWAGFVTSHCRAQLLRAAWQAPDKIIAFETDALFSTEPLDLPLSDSLGEWDLTEWTRLIYIQSGTYFGETTTGKVVEKTRGVDKGVLHWDDVLDALDRFTLFGEPERRYAKEYVTAQTTRFIGAGVALSQSFSRWRRWERTERAITLGPTGKRNHMTCYRKPRGHCSRFWHSAEVFLLADNVSHPFPVEWINPNPEMIASIEGESYAEYRKTSDWEFVE